jgi:hypothetical protein
MNKLQQEDIIQKIANLEITTELASYWKKRYEKIFDSDYFLLSQKTKQLLLDTKSVVDKPVTPFGDIVICRHLDKNLTLDEPLLQSSIEAIVRFLDACLDFINFSQEAKTVVDQYRKIGVGISDFEEYLESKKDSSEIHEIDYLGNLISSNCYRASEALAEEKGSCENWTSINKHLRAKPFEYWLNQETGEIKSGLELSETLNQELIKNSKYEIIPRRNSHILIFPVDLEWQIWNDRDETAPETKIEFVKKKQTALPKPLDFPKISSQNETNPVLEGKSETKKQIILTDKTLVKNELPQMILEDSKENKEIPESAFQIGELVHLKTKNSVYQDKIFQVVESFWDEHKETFRYQLSSGEEIEPKIYNEKELEHADVLKLLDKFNHTEYKINLFVNAIIINEKQEILVEKIQDKLILPGEQVLESTELKPFLKKLAKENYNIEITDFFETFIVEEIQTQTAETDLHLGYLLGVKRFELKNNLEWLSLQNIARLFTTDRHLVLEYIKFIDRFQESVEIEANKKAQEEIVKEMQILPTEEEIQHRIENEVSLRLQELINKDEEEKETSALDLDKERKKLEIEIEKELRARFEQEKIEYEKSLKKEIQEKEKELEQKNLEIQEKIKKLEESKLNEKAEETEEKETQIQELKQRLEALEKANQENEYKAKELETEKEELLKTLQKKLNENEQIEARLKTELELKKQMQKEIQELKEKSEPNPVGKVEDIEKQKYQSILDQIRAEAEQKQKEQESRFVAEIEAKNNQVRSIEEMYKQRVSELEKKIHTLSVKQTEKETQEKKKLIDYENRMLQRRMTNQEIQEEIERQVELRTKERTKEILARQQTRYNLRLQQERMNWERSQKIQTEAKIRKEVADRIAAIKNTGIKKTTSSVSALKIMQKYNKAK